MARRRRDRWALGPALSLPEAAYGGPVYDLPTPDPVLVWLQFPDRALEVEAHVVAWTDRAVLVDWGFGQAAESAWVWRDAVRAHPRALPRPEANRAAAGVGGAR
ncbi:hypothetical protein E9228_002750 [Curtobacterium flaccumfaciens]|uniref:MBL fold metallo-hydrolase n=1 Tax=Curtobacterium salicis TaxID=1779862 RepID=A0ABX0T9A5_9MICO|nr:hypothetical protein [Curtobacterium sp. WW7]NII42092.1 hypothetical protein [Curtobacterium sp. WW7]